MTQATEQHMIEILREIRDGQQAMLKSMEDHQALVRDQVEHSRGTVEESVGLQRLALKRQRTVTFIAVLAIIACIAAIAYLVLAYL